MTDNTLTLRELGEIEDRAAAATDGPWHSDENDMFWQLFGVGAVVPAQEITPEWTVPPQPLYHQLVKAPKKGTPYAEYWPKEADGRFIVRARTDVPLLAGEVRRLWTQQQRIRDVIMRLNARDAIDAIEEILAEGGEPQ